MSSHRSNLLSCVTAAALLSGWGCSDPYEKADESCNSNAQCPLNSFCDRPVNACAQEVDNRFVGTLSCEFTQSDGDPISYTGSSDISGWLMLQQGAQALRVNVNMGAFCNYSSDETGIFLTVGVDSTGTRYYMELRLPYPHAGVFQLMSMDSINAPKDQYEAGVLAISAVPPGSNSGTIIAESYSGFVVVDVDPVPGVIPSVYVDVEMIPLL